MRETMIRIEGAQKRIESAIAGDEKFGTKGLIHKHEELDEKINAYNKRISDVEFYQSAQKIRQGKIAAFSAIIGGGISAITYKCIHWITS